MADCKRKTANLFDKTAEYTVGSSTYNYTISRLDPDKYYTCSTNFERISGANAASIYFNGGNSNENGVWSDTPKTFKPDSNGQIIVYVRYRNVDSSAPIVINDLMVGKIWIMVNEGSTPLPYEPYGWVHSLRKLTTATDTIATPPVDIYADGTNATVGLKGNTVQSGTPTPTTPIQPQSCGERTENLSSTSTFNNTVTDTRSVFRCNLRLLKNNATIISKNIDISQTGLFYITATAEEVTDDIDRIIVRHSGQTSNFGVLSVNVNISSGTAVTFSANALGINPTVVGGVSLDQIMLNTGAYTPYQPYGYKIPISSANTTTPVYLGEVETTRRIKKLVLDGSEPYRWGHSSTRLYSWYIIATDLGAPENTPFLCTHGATVTSASDFVYGKVYCDNTLNIGIFPDSLNLESEVKQWLATQAENGTPVIIWYVSATEETGIVNEPLMKIGTYADTLSNAASIPTTEGANSITVDTTVQPSEFSATWTGWHDASVGEWDGSQWHE